MNNYLLIKNMEKRILNINDIKTLVENIINEDDLLDKNLKDTLPISSGKGKCYTENEIYQMNGDIYSLYQFLNKNENLFKNNENSRTLYPDFVDKIRRIKRVKKLLEK